MKKLLLASVAVVLLSMTACKKEYTCTCITTYATTTIPSDTSSYSIVDNKARAEEDCTERNVSTSSYTTTCTID